MRTVTSLLLASLIGASVIVGVGLAHAEDGFDLKVAPGQIVVTPKEGWHINLKYPWKLTMGDTKIDKTKFELSERSASVAAPKGTGKLRGAVCQGDSQCLMFEQAVTVP